MAELPERRIEDVLAGILRVTLGGETYVLPVRSIASNRRWLESLEAREGALLAAVGTAGNDLEALTAAIVGSDIGAQELLDLVIAYDEDHILPPRDQLEEVARPHELLHAVGDIRRVENPLADAGLAAASSAIGGRPSPVPTSSPPRNGASPRPRRSKKT